MFRYWLPAAFVFHPALLRRPSSVFRVLLSPSITVRRRSVVRPPTKGDVRDARRASCTGPTLCFPSLVLLVSRGAQLFLFLLRFCPFPEAGFGRKKCNTGTEANWNRSVPISYDRRRVDGPRLEANFKAYFPHAGASFQKERNSATHARKIGCTASHGNML